MSVVFRVVGELVLTVGELVLTVGELVLMDRIKVG